MSMTKRLAGLLFLAIAGIVAISCFPRNLSGDFDAVTLDPLGTPLAPLDVLDALEASDTPLESFRITSAQWDFAQQSTPGLSLKKWRVVEEFQQPNRWRTVIWDVEYPSDSDGNGWWESVQDSGGCGTQEFVTIETTHYERCGNEPWIVTEHPSFAASPISTYNLLGKARELDDLRRLEHRWLDRRPKLVFHGTVPEKPEGVTLYERTVWFDIETRLVRRIDEKIGFGSGSEHLRNLRTTADYTDYGNVNIEEPVINQPRPPTQ